MVLIKKIDPATQPPKQNSGSVGRKGGFKSKIKKPANERKRPLTDESIYGEELFAANIKTEKQIVIHFYPFTKNNLRITSCGRFIIKKVFPTMNEETKEFEFDGYRWDLFYFSVPITDFEPPKEEKDFREVEYVIDPTKVDKEITFFNDLEALKTKIIELVRAEFSLERQNRLQELRDQDAEEQRQKDDQELAEETLEETMTAIYMKPNEEVKNEVIEEVKEVPQFPVHMKIGIRTACGKLCLAVSNVTDDLGGVTCEKCLS